jgi:hypothetical protein
MSITVTVIQWNCFYKKFGAFQFILTVWIFRSRLHCTFSFTVRLAN